MSESTPRTELRSRERALERAYELIASPALDFEATLDAVLEVGCDVLETEYATLSRVHPDAGTYVFERVAVPADSPIEAGQTTSLADLPNCAAVVEREERLVVANVREEAPDLADPTWGIACYLGAPVTVEGTVYGTFCFFDTEPRDRAFSDWAETFVELLANWASGELERQRYVDRLDAIDELNAVVRETMTGALEAGDRDAIESTACRRLAEATAYEGAWIGEPAPAEPALSVRAVAGLDRASTAETVPIDFDGETAPAVAASECEAPVVRRTPAPDTPPPTENFAPAAARAVLAVPITYDGHVRAVLVVHSHRRQAFDGREREILADFAAQLGHAIAAAERERVVGSDAVSELTLRLPDAFAEHGVDGPADPVVIDDLLRRGGEGFLAYGRTTAAALSALRDLVNAHPRLVDVIRLAGHEEGVSFQLTGSAFPLLTRIYARGGTVERAVLDEGDVRLTVHLPTSVDTRNIVAAARAEATEPSVLAKQTVTRTEDGVNRADLLATLTDRQLTALRAAYAGGFYERPRETSGDEIADALDVAPATFSQQRRVAEAKLLRAIFEDDAP